MLSNELVESSSVGRIQGVTSTPPTTPVVTPLSWPTTIYFHLNCKGSSKILSCLPVCHCTRVLCHTKPCWLFFPTCYTTHDPCSLLLKCVRVCTNSTHRFIGAVVGHTDGCSCSWRKVWRADFSWKLFVVLVFHILLFLLLLCFSVPDGFCCLQGFLPVFSCWACTVNRPQGVKF